jgi:hypothetical protein
MATVMEVLVRWTNIDMTVELRNTPHVRSVGISGALPWNAAEATGFRGPRRTGTVSIDVQACQRSHRMAY